MTLSSLFHKYFGPTLLEMGFKRRRGAYYRLYNGEMLQGIVLKKTGNYSICYTSFPYWCFNYVNLNDLHPSMEKDYWIEDKHIFEYKGEMFITYFDPENPEENERCMQMWFEIAQEIIFPYFEETSTIKDYLYSYLDGAAEALERGGEKSIASKYIISQYLLLYRSYLDGNFDFAKRFINIYLDRYKELLHYMGRRDPAAIKEGIDRVIEVQFEVILQKIEENDLEWIKTFKEENAAIMRERMRQELKLDVPEP